MVTKMRFHIPAPKMVLPGHSESYNPPPEYLFTAEERLKWLATEPEDRRQNFMPQRSENHHQTDHMLVDSTMFVWMRRPAYDASYFCHQG